MAPNIDKVNLWLKNYFEYINSARCTYLNLYSVRVAGVQSVFFPQKKFTNHQGTSERLCKIYSFISFMFLSIYLYMSHGHWFFNKRKKFFIVWRKKLFLRKLLIFQGKKGWLPFWNLVGKKSKLFLYCNFNSQHFCVMYIVCMCVCVCVSVCVCLCVVCKCVCVCV